MTQLKLDLHSINVNLNLTIIHIPYSNSIFNMLCRIANLNRIRNGPRPAGSQPKLKLGPKPQKNSQLELSVLVESHQSGLVGPSASCNPTWGVQIAKPFYLIFLWQMNCHIGGRWVQNSYATVTKEEHLTSPSEDLVLIGGPQTLSMWFQLIMAPPWDQLNGRW